MEEPRGVLLIQVQADQADPEEIASLTSQLGRELLQLDLESVEQATTGPHLKAAKASPCRRRARFSSGSQRRYRSPQQS